ncbi:MAG: hypothetical protein ACRDPY_49090 [Streptosporangiaceae bacterium]
MAVLVGIGTTRNDRRRADAAQKKDAIDADRRLREQLAHSDEQFRRQQEHSDRQLAEERAAADERLRRQQEHSDRQLAEERAAADERLGQQFSQAEQIEQRGDAAAVQVIAFGIRPANVVVDPAHPAFEPVIIVSNRGRYAISNVQVRLSPDGRSIIEPGRLQPLADLRQLPEAWTNPAAANIGDMYLSSIAPGAAMRFNFDQMPADTLRTSFPIVRWDDRWDECWEYQKGVTYLTSRNAEWRP